MRILITGAHGQLGKSIKAVIESTPLCGDEYIFLDHNTFDITSLDSMEKWLFNYSDDVDCIINCAAYTNVEGAEDDPVGAFTVNSLGVKNLVDICKKYDIALFHISTDYVYDGGICDENSKLNPLGIYAQSKRDGEIFVENSDLKDWFIFRTSWLYSEYPGNFVTNLVERCKNVSNILYGVTDEYGCPTYARKLAQIIVGLIDNRTYETMPNGIYNICGNGYTSRYEFAKTIIARYINLPMFVKQYENDALNYEYRTKLMHINPISQEESYKIFKLKAPRPKNVIMSCKKLYDIIAPDLIWQTNMNDRWEIDLGNCLNIYDYMNY